MNDDKEEERKEDQPQLSKKIYYMLDFVQQTADILNLIHENKRFL